MRRAWLWGLGLTFIVSLGATACRAADENEEKPASPAKPITYGRGPGLFERWFSSNDKPVAKKPAKKDADATAKAKTEKAVTPAVESPVSIRAREQSAFERRLQVCLKLMDLANRQNDEELYRRAEELNEKAWAVYRERTAHLPAGNAGASDEEVLDRHLGSSSAAAPNLANPAPGTAKAKDRNSQASLREVQK
jgi:hypothetical protein